MKKIFLILTALIVSGTLFSCQTLKEIPEEKTPAQIIQMGQNEAAAGSYENAEFCYRTALKRASDDNSIFVQATYELGHIYTKHGKYDKAEEMFNNILKLDAEQPGAVLPKYIKLCNIDLERIRKAQSKEQE